jgi:hypothetical protein
MDLRSRKVFGAASFLFVTNIKGQCVSVWWLPRSMHRGRTCTRSSSASCRRAAPMSATWSQPYSCPSSLRPQPPPSSRPRSPLRSMSRIRLPREIWRTGSMPRRLAGQLSSHATPHPSSMAGRSRPPTKVTSRQPHLGGSALLDARQSPKRVADATPVSR